jgi:competence protein ComEC
MSNEMSLDIYFLNVGHGDCTVFDVNGRLTVIDINNSKVLDPDTEDELRELAKAEGVKAYNQAILRGDYRYSLQAYETAFMTKYRSLLTDPVDFLKTHFPGRDIWRFILTHPDMDHMTGLYRLRQEGISIHNFWDTRHEKAMEPRDFDPSGPYDYRDWEEYQRIQADPNIRKLRLNRGNQGQYYEEDGIWIASPTAALEKLASDTEHWNHLSYVLYVKHLGQWVVLGGDASVEAWENIYMADGGWFKKNEIRILKASHHGRDSGYHQPSVAAMSPDHTIVSVGKLPDTDASNKYRQYSNVYTTRTHGNIRAQVWFDGDVWLYGQDGERIDKPVKTAV